MASGIEEGGAIRTSRRVRTADRRRVVAVVDWCRIEHFSPDEQGAIGEGSIYTALAQRGLAVDHGVARVSPRNGTMRSARLAVPLGTLLITIVADAFGFTPLRRGPGEDES